MIRNSNRILIKNSNPVYWLLWKKKNLLHLPGLASTLVHSIMQQRRGSTPCVKHWWLYGYKVYNKVAAGGPHHRNGHRQYHGLCNPRLLINVQHLPQLLRQSLVHMPTFWSGGFAIKYCFNKSHCCLYFHNINTSLSRNTNFLGEKFLFLEMVKELLLGRELLPISSPRVRNSPSISTPDVVAHTASPRCVITDTQCFFTVSPLPLISSKSLLLTALYDQP